MYVGEEDRIVNGCFKKKARVAVRALNTPEQVRKPDDIIGALVTLLYKKPPQKHTLAVLKVRFAPQTVQGNIFCVSSSLSAADTTLIFVF